MGGLFSTKLKKKKIKTQIKNHADSDRNDSNVNTLMYFNAKTKRKHKTFITHHNYSADCIKINNNAEWSYLSSNIEDR